MIDTLLLPTMITAAIAGGIVVLAHEAGAFLYDVRAAKRLRHARNHPHARLYRERPLVTVLVSAHNDASSIERCLDSIFGNNYRKVEALVVDHASQDATKQIVRRTIAAHPKRRVRLVARRAKQGKAAGIEQAVRRYADGQLVMVLEAANYLNKTALARTTKHFASDAGLDILCPNEQVIPTPTIGGLFENYHALLVKRTNKFLSVAGMGARGGTTACYRADAFPKLHHRTGKHPHVRYAHDVSINTPGRSSFAKLLAGAYVKGVQNFRATASQSRHRRSLAGLLSLRLWLKMGYTLCAAIISVAGPLLTAYFLYLALWLHEPTLLLLSIAGLSAFLLFSIGEDEQLQPRQKVARAFGIPVTYGLFYLFGVSRLLAMMTAAIPNRALIFRRR